MSLSLISAPAADRPAAELRASQQAGSARKPDISESSPEKGEFEKLLDTVAQSDPHKRPVAVDQSAIFAADAVDSSDSLTADFQANPGALTDNFLPFPQLVTAALAGPKPMDPELLTAIGDLRIVMPEMETNTAGGLLAPFDLQSRPTPQTVSSGNAVNPPVTDSGPNQELDSAIAAIDRINLSTDPEADPARDLTSDFGPGALADPQFLGDIVPMEPLSVRGNPMPFLPVATQPAHISPIPSNPFGGRMEQTIAAIPEQVASGNDPAPAALLQKSATGIEVPALPIQSQPKSVVAPVTSEPDGPSTLAQLPNPNAEIRSVYGTFGPAITPAPSQTQLFAVYAAVTKMAPQQAPERPELAQTQNGLPEAVVARPSPEGPSQTIATLGAKNLDIGTIPHETDRRFGVETTEPASISKTGPAMRPEVSQKTRSDSAFATPVESVSQDFRGSPPLLSDVLRHSTGPTALEPAQPVHNTRAMAVHVASQLAQAASQTTAGTTDITLNPRELGQVKLSLQTIDGTMFVAIAAERPETAELMRRHIDSLAQEFKTLGYQDVSFTFSGRDRGNGAAPDPGHQQTADPGPTPQNDGGPNSLTDRYIPRRIAAQTGGTGLDLRL